MPTQSRRSRCCIKVVVSNQFDHKKTRKIRFIPIQISVQNKHEMKRKQTLTGRLCLTPDRVERLNVAGTR